jgi:hypothetical protein
MHLRKFCIDTPTSIKELKNDNRKQEPVNKKSKSQRLKEYFVTARTRGARRHESAASTSA